MIKFKLKKKYLATILLALLATIVIILFLPAPVPVQIDKAIRGDFYETITSDAIFRGKTSYTVTSMGTADMDRMPLEVGDKVKKGDLITRVWWDSREKYLRAPISGVISKVYRESAGPVYRGEPIVEIIDPTDLEVVAELLTSEAIKLRPGSPIIIHNWGGEKPLQAQVTKISQIGFTKRSALGVEEERTEVISDLKSQSIVVPETIGHNFYTDVTYIVSKYPNVIKVPVSALFKKENQWMVYIVTNNRARARKVDVIKMNNDEAAIQAGVIEGEGLINYPGDLVKDGTKIKKISSP